MLNIFKFHNNPVSIHAFEQSILDDPELLAEMDIPDDPVILKIALELLDSYKDSMHRTMAKLLGKEYYHKLVAQRILVLCAHGEYKKNPTLLDLLFNIAHSIGNDLPVNDMKTLIAKNVHTHNKQIIPGYVSYLQTGDSTALVNSLLSLFAAGDINVYLLMEMIDSVSNDPNIYNKIFKKLPSDYEIRYELQEPHAWSGNVTSLSIGLMNMQPIIHIYDKLPEKLQILVKSKFVNLIHDVDSKLAREITNYKLTNLRCNSEDSLQKLNHVAGSGAWSKTSVAISNIYHDLNSHEVTKNINKLTGKEQKDAITAHSESIQNIIGCMSAFK